MDVKVSMFAEALSQNLTLKTLSFRTLKISSEEELNVLGDSLQKNLTLSMLNGVSEADAMRLRTVLIEGPFERSAVLRFSNRFED